MNNYSTSGPTNILNRIDLRIVDDANLSGTVRKTYCTYAEVNAVLTSACSGLSVNFQATDAKQTANGDFIICGYVSRDSGEYNGCGAPQYYNQFLLRTEADGDVIWYKRYVCSNLNNNFKFNSLVEDAITGNILLCGNAIPNGVSNVSGFIMGTNSSGSPLWAHYVNTYSYTTSARLLSSFSEITPFYSTEEGSLFALTGPSGGIDATPNPDPGNPKTEGGALLTVVDASGNFYQNVTLTEDHESRILSGLAIHDANNGTDVFLTGFSGLNICTDLSGYGLSVIRLNPLSLSYDFARYYDPFPEFDTDVARGTSIIHHPNRPNSVFIEGVYKFDGLYAEVHSTGGTMIRYTPMQQTTSATLPVEGQSITVNSNTNHSVYTGNLQNGGTYLIKDIFGYDCSENLPVEYTNLDILELENDETAVTVTAISDTLLDFDLENDDQLECNENIEPCATIDFNSNIVAIGDDNSCYWDVTAVVSTNSPWSVVSYSWEEFYTNSGYTVLSSSTSDIFSNFNVPYNTMRTLYITVILEDGEGHYCEVHAQVTLGCEFAPRKIPTAGNQADGGYTAFPNPTTSSISVKSDSNTIQNVIILDITGKQVATYDMDHVTKAEISMDHLSAGTYFLKINNEVVKIVNKN